MKIDIQVRCPKCGYAERNGAVDTVTGEVSCLVCGTNLEDAFVFVEPRFAPFVPPEIR